jgi:hypothetical protein
VVQRSYCNDDLSGSFVRKGQRGIPPLLRLRRWDIDGYPALRAQKTTKKTATVFFKTL